MFITEKYTYVEVIPTPHELYGTVYNLRGTTNDGESRLFYTKFLNRKYAEAKLGAEIEILL